MEQYPNVPHKENVSNIIEIAREILERSYVSPFIWDGESLGERTVTHFVGNPVELRVLDEWSALSTGVAAEWQVTHRDFDGGNHYCHLTYVFGFDGSESIIIRRNDDPEDIVTGVESPKEGDQRTPADRTNIAKRLYSLRNLFAL